MQNQKLTPQDFIYDFSPDNQAELSLWEVHDYPEKNLLGISKRVLQSVIKLWKKEKSNDEEIQYAFEEIAQRYGIVDPDSICKYLENKYAKIDHLRKFEYPFLVKCLVSTQIRKGVIVDIGGGASYSTIVPLLLNLPELHVVSVDVVHHSNSSKFNVEYIIGNCIESSLPDNYSDFVTAISTIEHVGLGRWGDPMDPQGDIKAMKEIRRILKPGGYLVLTFPFGYPSVIYNLHRAYDWGRINKLIEGFEIIDKQFSLNGCVADQSDVVGVKTTKDIPGFYKDIPYKKMHPDSPGGILLFLKKK